MGMVALIDMMMSKLGLIVLSRTYLYAASPVATGLSTWPTTNSLIVLFTPSAPMMRSHGTTSPEASVHEGAEGSMEATDAFRRRSTLGIAISYSI